MIYLLPDIFKISALKCHGWKFFHIKHVFTFKVIVSHLQVRGEGLVSTVASKYRVGQIIFSRRNLAIEFLK